MGTVLAMLLNLDRGLLIKTSRRRSVKRTRVRLTVKQIRRHGWRFAEILRRAEKLPRIRDPKAFAATLDRAAWGAK